MDQMVEEKMEVQEYGADSCPRKVGPDAFPDSLQSCALRLYDFVLPSSRAPSPRLGCAVLLTMFLRAE